MATLHVTTQSKTLDNSVVENTLFPTAEQISLPANEVVIGTALRIVMRGFYSTTLIPPTLRIRVKIGASTILDSGAQTCPIANAASHVFGVDVLLVFSSVGASGKAAPEGWVILFDDSGLAQKSFELVATATQTVDTTVDGLIQVTAQWGTANAANSITMFTSVVELL